MRSWTAHHGWALPPEFTLLGFEPEPWTGPDVLVWSKMMAWDLSANYAFELLRHDLSARVGPSRMSDLLPPYPPDGLNILDDSAEPMPAPARPAGPYAQAGAAAQRGAHGRCGHDIGRPDWSVSFASALEGGHPFVRALLRGGATTEGVGSNNWVVDGSRTASGQPLLANDPHLAANVPSLWYLAHMSAGDFDVIGGTLPGTPAVAIGRNRHIAWGETNMFADVQDLYRERLDASGSSAEFKGTMEPLRTIKEVITVSGGEPIELTVRISRHGPLVSDAINANNAASSVDPKPVAARTARLPLDSAGRAGRDRRGVSPLERSEELERIHRQPARVRGPVAEFRLRGRRGSHRVLRSWPRADSCERRRLRAGGRLDRRDGVERLDSLRGSSPRLRPAIARHRHREHRPVPREYPYFLGAEYHQPFRAQRITDLLHDKDKLTPEDFRGIQADTLSLHAQSLRARAAPARAP